MNYEVFIVVYKPSILCLFHSCPESIKENVMLEEDANISLTNHIGMLVIMCLEVWMPLRPA